MACAHTYTLFSRCQACGGVEVRVFHTCTPVPTLLHAVHVCTDEWQRLRALVPLEILRDVGGPA